MKAFAFLPVCLALSLLASFGNAESPRKDSKTRNLPDAGCAVQFSSMVLHNSHIGFSFANNSERTIQGIEFGAAVYDSVQEPHRILVDGGVRRHLRYGQQVSYDLDISRWKGTGYAGWMLWPSKVLYTDGSTWEMGSNHSACGIEHWIDKQIRPSISPIELLAQVPELGSN